MYSPNAARPGFRHCRRATYRRLSAEASASRHSVRRSAAARRSTSEHLNIAEARLVPPLGLAVIGPGAAGDRTTCRIRSYRTLS